MNPVNPNEKYPIGILNTKKYDPSLKNVTNIEPNKVLISQCSFPHEFTCKNNECIDIFKRCNYKKDCSDGSDEVECQIIRTPQSYDISQMPEISIDAEYPNQISTQVTIINIEKIDSINMIVGLTVKLNFKWSDPRVDFLNVKNSLDEQNPVFRMVPIAEKDKVWLPFHVLIHDNAIIGETEIMDFYELGIEISGEPILPDPNQLRETLVYPGKDNKIVVSRRQRLKYYCEFHLHYFPFDETTCNFILYIPTIKNTSVRLEKIPNSSLIYTGPRTLNEFEIMDFWTSTYHHETNTSFVYTCSG